MPARWKPEQVEFLVELWKQGLSARQIASKLGLESKNAVIGKLHRLGLTSKTRKLEDHVPDSKNLRFEPLFVDSRHKDRRCRWPIGNPSDPNFHFCSQSRRPGKSYCQKHSLIIHRRDTTD